LGAGELLKNLGRSRPQYWIGFKAASDRGRQGGREHAKCALNRQAVRERGDSGGMAQHHAESVDIRSRRKRGAVVLLGPDLSPDVGAVLAALPPEDAVEFVWETQDGTINHAIVDDTESPSSPPWLPAPGRPAPCP
jgi:hypothetical protein